MGRPRKGDGERREPVTVKLTAREKAELLAAMDAAQATGGLATFMRDRALKGRTHVLKRTELAPADRVALQRVGVNLNQIARRLNEAAKDGTATVQLAEELPEAQRDVRVALDVLNTLLLKGSLEP